MTEASVIGMTRGTWKIYPFGRNKSFSSKFESLEESVVNMSTIVNSIDKVLKNKKILLGAEKMPWLVLYSMPSNMAVNTEQSRLRC